MRNAIVFVGNIGALLFVMLSFSGCSDNTFDEKLKAMSGNDYLALSETEKNEFVEQSLDRFTTWKLWERPDLCDYVLEFGVLSDLYGASARKAQDNPLAFIFAVDANEQCVLRGQTMK